MEVFITRNNYRRVLNDLSRVYNSYLYLHSDDRVSIEELDVLNKKIKDTIDYTNSLQLRYFSSRSYNTSKHVL